MQATDAHVLEANVAASASVGQLLPALGPSADSVWFPLAALSAGVAHSEGHSHGQFLELGEQIHGFAESSSFAALERCVLETTSILPNHRPDDAALAALDFSDASRPGASLQSTDVPVAAVPEPSTYALMFGSMSIIGSTARRRRNDAVGWMASRRREDVAG